MIALAIALAVAAVVLWATGGQPVDAFKALFQGAFGSENSILRTLAKATPLLLSGLAVAIAFRAGMFNIGAEGQIMVGALASAVVGFAAKGLPFVIHLPLAILTGMAAGGLWAFVPGVLKAWRGTHEVIVTIMMNYIAFNLCHYLVNKPFKDPHTLASATPRVLPSAQLWAQPGGTNFSAGFFIALVAAACVAFLIKRTALGYEIRAVGLNPDAARAAGLNVPRTLVISMVLSGALAGLAGAVQVLAVEHRYLDTLSAGYGFDSIAVALLGGLNALGVVLAAILFGGLNSGAIFMESWTSTPRQIAGIVQAVVILAVGVRYMRRAS